MIFTRSVTNCLSTLVSSRVSHIVRVYVCVYLAREKYRRDPSRVLAMYDTWE